MTDQQHPITPPPELLQQWATEYWGNPGESIGCGEKYIATQAARWGADQELEACCEWMDNHLFSSPSTPLRAARRPKPPSLAEEALTALEDGDMGPAASLTSVEVCIIRRALERLQELEKGNE